MLNQCNDEINYRNKLIKLADKSETGWATVNEYIDNDLADNSDDDRKIRRAENAAKAERKRKREFHQRRRGG